MEASPLTMTTQSKGQDIPLPIMKLKKPYRLRKRRWLIPYIFTIASVFTLCYLCVIFYVQPVKFFDSDTLKHGYIDTDSRSLHRRLLSTTSADNLNRTTSDPSVKPATSSSNFPPDAFTMEQRRQGAVVCHILGIIYMFVALAIVCDEYFVPSLEVIIDKLQISEDVAGATFMAAGGSAPELFTSFISVFFSGDNVGIGTIVGSAVFNILFVIGMCAIFSKTVLELTWWPLFRDVFFYSVSLLVLIGSFQDNRIDWYESLLLLLCYAVYVIFMKFNEKVEYAIKSRFMKNKVTTVRSTDNLIKEQQMQRRCSVPLLHGGGSKFRQGVLQLMIHTIDPLGEAKIQDKAMQLHAVASLKVLMSAESGLHHEPNHNSKPACIPAISNGQLGMEAGTRHHSQESQQTTLSVVSGNAQDERPEVISQRTVNSVFVTSAATPPPDLNSVSSDTKSQKEDLVETENEPLDLSWPETARKRIVYVIVFPIVLPLWLFLPDVRRPEKAKWFPVTFLGSIMAIGFFSYLMNWWANVVGETLYIPLNVMGLTFLAAGTSIPDLITSVIVAMKGYGDMAVSSSVGSNIFDVTIGLPLPWILWSFSHQMAPNLVIGSGLFCSIVLLFAMLILVIVCIAAFKWKMHKFMGIAMFALYIVFLTVALLLEFRIFICPIGG